MTSDSQLMLYSAAFLNRPFLRLRILCVLAREIACSDVLPGTFFGVGERAIWKCGAPSNQRNQWNDFWIICNRHRIFIFVSGLYEKVGTPSSMIEDGSFHFIHSEQAPDR